MAHLSKKKGLKMTTLTIRIAADLKADIMELAHRSGEDASTWIRRFFESVRSSEEGGEGWVGDENGPFSSEFIQSILAIREKGKFKKFDLKNYV